MLGVTSMKRTKGTPASCPALSFWAKAKQGQFANRHHLAWGNSGAVAVSQEHLLMAWPSFGPEEIAAPRNRRDTPSPFTGRGWPGSCSTSLTPA